MAAGSAAEWGWVTEGGADKHSVYQIEPCYSSCLGRCSIDTFTLHN